MEQFTKQEFDTKQEFYKSLNTTLQGMIISEEDWLANLCNAAALMGMMFNDINWSGFYLYKNQELILGPFWGKPACTHIEIGEGVCGTVAKNLKTLIVDDVHEFPGHIACDAVSRSEIVIPIVKSKGNLLGVIDIDSPSLSRFDHEDATGLEQFADLLVKHIQWSSIE